MDLSQPASDPTQILDDFRASALSQLLVAGITRFDLGAALRGGPVRYEDLCRELQLKDRPATVLLTGFRALGLIDVTADQLICLTPVGMEKLNPDSPFNLRGYIALGAFSADTQQMMACLSNDAPAGSISFVYHEGGSESALDDPETSDALTRAMAARARNIAPFVAELLDLSSCRHLADIGGAHGTYSLELLKRFRNLKATIVDRQPPLKVAAEYAQQADLTALVQPAFADIHQYRMPTDVDVVLLANILHDYNLADATRLVAHYASQLPVGGRMVILDAFLDSVPAGSPPVSTGPRPIAAYSAMLFSICEGRCYRQDEYESMQLAAGLTPDATVQSVPAYGSLLTGIRRC